MAGSKQQFDSLLGGHSQLPSGVNILNIISARAQEIEALTEAIDDPQKSGLVFQRLPKHMRRRIMSHNVKRMPRRLREAHLRQMEKSGLPPKSKRPSRKYRRRPSNLLQEYNRRQRKYVWLETHIWHAKRFHMLDKWGYKLPHFPNDKSFRACYRASANHCLLQDLSYYCCIELRGPYNSIIDGLRQHTSTACGLTFAGKVYYDGSREGQTTVFKRNSYPYGAIGKVTFLWRPSQVYSCDVNEPTESLERTLWLWVHPAFHEELCSELVNTFELLAINMDVNETLQTASNEESGPRKEPLDNIQYKQHERSGLGKKLETDKLNSKTAFYHRAFKYESREAGIKMVLLKDTLNRFRLTGPLSHSVLRDALNIASVNKNRFTEMLSTVKGIQDIGLSEREKYYAKKELSDVVEMVESAQDKTGRLTETEESMELDPSDKSKAEEIPQIWWEDICSNTNSLECVNLQNNIWNNLKGVSSPAQLPPNCVLGLVVIDPRHSLPAKRVKSNIHNDDLWPQDGSGPGVMSFPSQVSYSPLWEPEVREAVTTSKPSSAEIDSFRSDSLIPLCGTEASVTATRHSIMREVPILLVQRPGSQDASTKRLGLGCGWDIILPAGWAMPFWLALVYRGARAGGLREAACLSFEALHNTSESFLAPDTNAGDMENACTYKQLHEAHFRLPPDKRPNYITLGSKSPFMCSWDLLVKEWCAITDNEQETSSANQKLFYVLRDKKLLQELKLHLQKHPKKNPVTADLSLHFKLYEKCLVPVFVTVKDRGIPADFSIICIPDDEDLRKITSQSIPGPTEPLHEDSNRQVRNQLRHEHQKKLKSLRRQRQAQKRKLEENCSNGVCSDREDSNKTEQCTKPLCSKAVIEEHAVKMSDLWMPNLDTIKNSCTRVVAGFIYRGGFSFSEGIGVGLGYITLPALFRIITTMSSEKPWVLVRNTSSQQYRYAVLHIHCHM